MKIKKALSTLAILCVIVVFSSCEQEMILPSTSIENSEFDGVSFQNKSNLLTTTTTLSNALTTYNYECASPASASASSTYWASSVNGAIDCDTTTNWNSGGWNAAWYRITFESPRSFSGLRITSEALPAETQVYSITATKSDNSTITITENFTIGDLSNPAIGGRTNKDFDFGIGVAEFTSVQINLPENTRSWKAIQEVKLIVPVTTVVDADGDGIPDAEDSFPNSNMEEFVNVGACSSGVLNQILSSGATFNDLLEEARTTAGNHGKYVSAVSKLANSWKKTGLISGREMGKIVSCAAQSNLN